ncbi:MAG TPA: phosphatase PAP2 family protein [Allosphingosinicella sp.]
MTRTIILCALLAVVWTAMLLSGAGPVDHELLRALHAGGDTGLARAAWIVTQFGGSPVVLPVSAVGALILIVRRDLRGAALLLGITLSGRIAIDLAKAWTGRPRPPDFLHLVGSSSDSFPSGHTGNATLVWIAMALLIPRDPRLRIFLLWGAALLSVAVGFTRPMLGVHWPSDVVAGWALGIFWILILLKLSGWRSGPEVRPS